MKSFISMEELIYNYCATISILHTVGLSIVRSGKYFPSIVTFTSVSFIWQQFTNYSTSKVKSTFL